MPSDDQLQIRSTSDGSATLYHASLNETYHSLNGAWSESLHVYIRNGLDHFAGKKNIVRILEIGFGTGVNALLTIAESTKFEKIVYHTLEPFPLSETQLDAYYQTFTIQIPEIRHLQPLLRQEPGNDLSVSECFNFTWFNQTLQDFEGPANEPYDLIYYDAFAPSVQPELWSEESLGKVHGLMAPGTCLTTYCAQGQFKRNLKAIGFEVSHPKGPHGKREMTNAFKI